MRHMKCQALFSEKRKYVKTVVYCGAAILNFKARVFFLFLGLPDISFKSCCRKIGIK